MLFARIKLNGVECDCFAFTKWSATVFTVFGKNKKAPDDEQAIRFAVYDGKPVVWATDGHQLVTATPSEGTLARIGGDREQYLVASSLKGVVQKARVSQTVLFPINAPEVFVVDGKIDLRDGEAVEAELLGSVDIAGECSFGREVLDALRGFEQSAEIGAPAWSITSRFAALFAAVAKATNDEDAWCLNPPRAEAAPMIVRVVEALDDSAWTIFVMPRQAAP